jgi:hypothetical protein
VISPLFLSAGTDLLENAPDGGKKFLAFPVYAQTLSLLFLYMK